MKSHHYTAIHLMSKKKLSGEKRAGVTVQLRFIFWKRMKTTNLKGYHFSLRWWRIERYTGYSEEAGVPNDWKTRTRRWNLCSKQDQIDKYNLSTKMLDWERNPRQATCEVCYFHGELYKKRLHDFPKKGKDWVHRVLWIPVQNNSQATVLTMQCDKLLKWLKEPKR